MRPLPYLGHSDDLSLCDIEKLMDNKSFVLRELRDLLQASDQTIEILSGASGQTLLAFPHGARVIGLADSLDSPNSFWVNSAFNDVATANAFFRIDQWHNSGGDRTWLAPEVSYFYPKYPDTAFYRPPKCLDAETYDVQSDSSQITFRRQMQLHSFQSGEVIEVDIRKVISLVENPLADTLHSQSCSFAGYQLATELSCNNALQTSQMIGIWNLLQLPLGGEMYVPVSKDCKPSVYFGEIVPEDLEIKKNILCYRMRSAGLHKIGLSPDQCDGIMAYLHSTDSESTLTVRKFDIDLEAVYADKPLGIQRNGDAVQFCNVNKPEIGKFAEMEYHAPAIGGSTGKTHSRDVSRVFVFRGQRATLYQIMDQLFHQFRNDRTSL